ncbi:Hypothetical protein FKW44_011421 [Caligus rogercresseyi]|uniref:Uncharacterized protein n=1 Tax=Caligus rogercresseyi TaxID=217165 RepID=A0A7T8HHZ9_CALRO|nr:Hypothetical protein FKW44_011421 [Caligus rogercresseyi]
MTGFYLEKGRHPRAAEGLSSKAKATLSHGLGGSDVGREKAPIIFVEEGV